MYPLAAQAEFRLSNDQVAATWKLADGKSAAGTLRAKATGQTVTLDGELFTLLLPDGSCHRASELKIVGQPRVERLAAKPDASRLAERLPGTQLVVDFTGDNLHATWRAVLRDGSNYLRQQVTLVGNQDLPLKELVMLDIGLAHARPSGTVEGSPVVTETVFCGLEHPLSLNQVAGARVRCVLPRGTPLEAGEALECSSVIGFVPEGQLRRGFLAYLERERAHPYRPFLNYNTWYDIGYFSRFDEAAAHDTIRSFGEELVVKRGVRLDSFLLDDGWDDPASLYRPHRGFPNGFGSLAKLAKHYGAALGFWLSPWGGYGPPKEERLQHGREEGFEIVNGGFSLAGPKFYERFRGLCVEVIRDYGVNQFKFDGIGTGDSAGAGAAIRDFEAMLRLLAELRALKPDLYINQTTGTWPSPFWLMHADSIWRGGDDHDFAGVGSDRQRWITYRDGDVYQEVVTRAELYPLNSLMLHGMIYARSAKKLNVDPGHDFRSEVRSFFGSGTQMQEMYITPKLLAAADWDALAESARWARENADTLVDTHWVGGDPTKLQVYGWAAWSPRKGILTLRNPSDKPAEIAIDPAKVFELPAGASHEFKLSSPYADQHLSLSRLRSGETATFSLAPFEVLVVEAHPVH